MTAVSNSEYNNSGVKARQTFLWSTPFFDIEFVDIKTRRAGKRSGLPNIHGSGGALNRNLPLLGANKGSFIPRWFVNYLI